MTDQRKDRRGLGRGLSALMADVAFDDRSTGRRSTAETMPVERLVPNPSQPRRDFPQASLDDLAASIRAKGVIQPLIVRPSPGDADTYEIVAGERRWRAAQLAQLHDVPVLVRELDDSAVLELAIIENIQRADLNAVEEALAYRQLMDRFGHTQEQLGEALGKSRSHIANLLRLLSLPEDVLGLLRRGELSAGHARALIVTDDPAALARQVVAKSLSVRETEALAKGPRERKPRRVAAKDADTEVLEQDLSAALGMAISIDHKPGAAGGRLSVRYATLEELDTLCALLSARARTGSREQELADERI